MPRRLFITHEAIEGHPSLERSWTDDEIRSVARTFGVSREAAVRRLLTFDLTDQSFYVRKRSQYLRELEDQRQRELDTSKDKEMRRNMPREAISNLGRSYVRLILQNYNDDRITLMDASQYLGVRPEKVRNVEELARCEESCRGRLITAFPFSPGNLSGHFFFNEMNVAEHFAISKLKNRGFIFSIF